jgi:type I restriction enzyme M protein
MIGAVIGDIAASRFGQFEWFNQTKKFEFYLSYLIGVSNDSMRSLVVAKALLDCGGDYSKFGEMYSDVFVPYINSGYSTAMMRVLACGFAASSLDEAIDLSRCVTEIMRTHPEGIKGAEVTAGCVFLARRQNISEIREYVNERYYPMNFTLDGIRGRYRFNQTCRDTVDTVPQAIMAFLESVSFEDAISNAISIGGDDVTLAAITGSIAEAYYGVPDDIRKYALTFLNGDLLRILTDFEDAYPQVIHLTYRTKIP